MELWTCIGLALATALVGHAWGRMRGPGVVVYAEVDEGERGRWRWQGYDHAGQRRSNCFPQSWPTSSMAADDVRFVHPGIKVTVLTLLLALIGPVSAEAQIGDLLNRAEQLVNQAEEAGSGLIEEAAAAAGRPAQPPELNVTVETPAAAAVMDEASLSPDTLAILIGMGALAVILLALVIVLGRDRGQRDHARALSLQQLGDEQPQEEETVRAVQDCRSRAVGKLFAGALCLALTIQIAETLAETFYPGLEDTLNLLHILSYTATIVFFALLVLFGPVTRDVFPAITWLMLVYGTAAGAKKPPPIQVRVALIYAYMAIAVTTMLVAATFSGG